jgi:hypothetical protein
MRWFKVRWGKWYASHKSDDRLGANFYPMPALCQPDDGFHLDYPICAFPAIMQTTIWFVESYKGSSILFQIILGPHISASSNNNNSTFSIDNNNNKVHTTNSSCKLSSSMWESSTYLSLHSTMEMHKWSLSMRPKHLVFIYESSMYGRSTVWRI